jgi:site-specific recombinase XerD
MSLSRAMNEEFQQSIITSLQSRGYQESTIKSYSTNLFNLFSFFPKTDPTKITNEQVCKYVKSLIARKLSRSTIKQLYHACDFFYEDLNNIKHGIYKVRLPPTINEKITFLSQSEAFQLIDNSENIKHRCMLLLMYACGLESGAILNLRIEHVRSKEKPPHIQIHDKNGAIRRALLLVRAIPVIQEYYRSYHPTDWLFYGQDSNGKESKQKQYSATSLRRVFEKRIKDEELDTSLKTGSLRLAHIKHMSDLGVPVNLVLDQMGSTSFETHLKYAKILYGDDKVDFTPLDRRIDDDLEIQDFKELEHLVFKLSNRHEIDYLLEALNCLRNGALRAGVIFIWSAGIRNIQQKILDKTTLKVINQELEKIDKSRKIKNIESFEYIKDETTLLLSHRLDIYDKFEKLELTNSSLGLRNKCGHPSNYKPEIQKVKAFVEDMIKMVFANNRHLTDIT